MSFIPRPFLDGKEEVQLLVANRARVMRWHEYDAEFLKTRGILPWQPLELVSLPYRGRTYLMNVARGNQRGDYLSWNLARSLILTDWMSSSPWVMVGDRLWMWNYYSDALDSPLSWSHTDGYVVENRSSKPVVPITFPRDVNQEMHAAIPQYWGGDPKARLSAPGSPAGLAG